MSQVSRDFTGSEYNHCRWIHSAESIPQIKEADFVRWGSTRRVTNLRQREAESLWEGLVERLLIFSHFGSLGHILLTA